MENLAIIRLASERLINLGTFAVRSVRAALHDNRRFILP